MQILVRRSSIQDAEPARFLKFRNRTGFERLYGVKRGVLLASVTLLDGRQVLIGNTHLTPFTEYANVRRAQIDQLSSFICHRRAPNSTVILGGDLNIAGDYSALTGKDRRRLESALWLYSYFKAKLEMTDSHAEMQPQQPLFTFNNLFPPLNGVRRSAAEKRLDYIWHSNARTTQIGIEFSSPINGVFPSDHFLYYAILEI
jgi:endonuclease/exonuclease/phosphatase (EEP) superfamily protein YafD